MSEKGTALSFRGAHYHGVEMPPKVSTTKREPRSLRKNFSWTFLGNGVYAASQWLLLIVLARFGSQNDVGQYALATAICAPIILFSQLKLRSVQAADALDEFRFGTYLALRLVTSVAAFLVILAIIFLTSYRGALAWTIAAVAIAKTFESISDVFHGLQQRHERMEVIARSLIVKSLLSVFAFTVGLIISNSLIGGLAGLIMAWAITLIWFDIPQAKNLTGREEVRPRWTVRTARNLAILSLPLGLQVTIASLFSSVPRYFIGGLLSTQELGVFAAISYIMVAGSMVIAALAQSATPRLAKLYRNHQKQSHYQLTLRLLFLGTTIGLIGIVIVAFMGETILKIAYGPAYAVHSDLFLWIMVDAFISYAYVFLGTALTSMRKFNVQLPVHACGLVILIAACAILVPSFGLRGAVWAMIIANLVQAFAYSLIFFVHFKSDNGPSVPSSPSS